VASLSAYDAYLHAADLLDVVAAGIRQRGVGDGTASALEGEARQMRQDLDGAPEGALHQIDRQYLFAVLDEAKAVAALVPTMQPPPGSNALTLAQDRQLMLTLKGAIGWAQTALRR